MYQCSRCDAPTRAVDHAGRCRECRPQRELFPPVDVGADREAVEHRREADRARRLADKLNPDDDSRVEIATLRRLVRHHEREADWLDGAARLAPQADGHP